MTLLDVSGEASLCTIAHAAGCYRTQIGFYNIAGRGIVGSTRMAIHFIIANFLRHSVSKQMMCRLRVLSSLGLTLVKSVLVICLVSL